MEPGASRAELRPRKPGRFPRQTLAALRRAVDDPFGIDHVTIQLEPPGFEERETDV